MEPNVLIGLNCSLSPSPFSIALMMNAKTKANEVGIKATIRMSQQSVSGYLMGNTFALDVINSDKYTHLLMACDDIAVPEDAIIKLVQDDKDIISGIYRRRGDDNKLCAYLFDTDKLAQHVNNKELVEVVYCPGHSMLVKREVLVKMYEAYPETEYRNEDGNMIRGIFMPFVYRGTLFLDDYAFSARAVALGFKCWMDFSVRLRHRWYVWLDVPDKIDELR